MGPVHDSDLGLASSSGLGSGMNPWGRSRRFFFSKKRWILLLTLILIVLIFLSWRFMAEYRAILRTGVDVWARDQRADCAVVLTGGSGRVKEGMDLLARKMVRKLIISGVNPHADWREIFPNWPYYQDVSEADIVLERRSRTTFGNAQQTMAVSDALGCRDLLVVTSVYHLHRSLKTFRAEFGDRIPVEGRAISISTGELQP
ncbi:MAG: YdcF family protein, partial [Bdellovibrionales bacterium]|nr:YdcF family protein [Bdellovibrionales bacterium]